MSEELKVCKICAKGDLTIYYRAVCKECRRPQQHNANQKYYDENKAEIKSYELNKYYNSGKEIRKEYTKNYGASYRHLNMEEYNFKKCWALDNLRPYSAKQNILYGVNKTRHYKKRAA